MTSPRRIASALIAVALAAGSVGCATGDDAAVYGGSFTFTSPGGVTDFAYAPDEREKIGTLAGRDLMTDEPLAAADFAGKVVFVNFWGSWCGPCREEQDSLNLVATELADEGVQFLGIDVRDSRSDGQDFYRLKDVPYPSIFDPTMRTLLSIRGYPAAMIPSALVLDRQGRVAQIWLASAEVPMGEMKARLSAIAAESS